MSEFLKNIVAGMSNVRVAFPGAQRGSRPYVSARGGFSRDAAALRQDVRSVCADFSAAARKTKELHNA